MSKPRASHHPARPASRAGVGEPSVEPIARPVLEDNRAQSRRQVRDVGRRQRGVEPKRDRLRRPRQLGRRAERDEPAAIDDRDPVGDLLDIAQVVARQQDRHALVPEADRSAPRVAARASTSIPAVGSSSATSAGLPTSASARPSRCRSPPDNRRIARPGHRSSAPPARATRPRRVARRGIGHGAGEPRGPSSADRPRRRPGASARPAPGDPVRPAPDPRRGPERCRIRPSDSPR